MKDIMKIMAAALFKLSLAIPNAESAPSEPLSIKTYNTNVVDQGQGPALILVHGLGADLSRWQANIETLAKTHRVIAIDLIGFGKSDKPKAPYRVQVFVNQVVALLDDLGIESAILVGNSMGGIIALNFAEQFPERTDALVLVAPAFVYGLPEGMNAESLARAASPKTTQEMNEYFGRIYHQPPTDPSFVQAELTQKQDVGDEHTIFSVARSLEKHQDLFTNARIKLIVERTLILHGERDGIVPISASRSLAKLMPNAEFTSIQNAGHWPQLEQFELFNRLLQEWVSK